jgi:hypothetical protein
MSVVPDAAPPPASAAAPGASEESTAAPATVAARRPPRAPRMPQVTSQQLTLIQITHQVNGVAAALEAVEENCGVTAAHLGILQALVAKQMAIQRTAASSLLRTRHDSPDYNDDAQETARFRQRFRTLMDEYGGNDPDSRKIVDGMFITHEVVLLTMDAILSVHYTLCPARAREDKGNWRQRLSKKVWKDVFSGGEGAVPTTIPPYVKQVLDHFMAVRVNSGFIPGPTPRKKRSDTGSRRRTSVESPSLDGVVQRTPMQPSAAPATPSTARALPQVTPSPAPAVPESPATARPLLLNTPLQLPLPLPLPHEVDLAQYASMPDLYETDAVDDTMALIDSVPGVSVRLAPAANSQAAFGANLTDPFMTSEQAQAERDSPAAAQWRSTDRP